MDVRVDERGRMRTRYFGLAILAVALAACTSQPAGSGRKSPTATPSSSPTPSTSPVSYRGWKVFRSHWESASFMYPPDWTSRVENLNVGIDGGGEAVVLTAPDGFQVSWIVPLSGIGGGCDTRAPHVFIDRILTMPAIASRHRLYVAVSRQEGRKNLSVVDVTSVSPSLKLGDTGSCLYYPTFESRRRASLHDVEFSTGYATPSAYNNRSNRLTVSEYLGTADARTALLIFRSFRYK